MEDFVKAVSIISALSGLVDGNTIVLPIFLVDNPLDLRTCPFWQTSPRVSASWPWDSPSRPRKCTFTPQPTSQRGPQHYDSLRATSGADEMASSGGSCSQKRGGSGGAARRNYRGGKPTGASSKENRGKNAATPPAQKPGAVAAAGKPAGET